jgi:hypothetical protein
MQFTPCQLRRAQAGPASALGRRMNEMMMAAIKENAELRAIENKWLAM